MIRFNIPYQFDNSFKEKETCGDNKYTKLCHKWFEDKFKCKKALLTTSCTHALEMAAILLDIKEGDEIIMPSYTFVSTANAFVLRGAKIVFVDIRPNTMNIDERKIEAAITSKTKVIVPVHYAGIACDMDSIMTIARKHNLFVVEDAAQGVMSSYKGKALGTIGDIGCYSFHETKNYSMGEGGAIIINNEKFIERAEIIREKGTNRTQFFRGEVDKYTWVDIGSSYLPSDILAYYLYTQLLIADKINNQRLALWDGYYNGLKPLLDKGFVDLPIVPRGCKHNGHMFYIKLSNLNERSLFLKYLKENSILGVFHYIPLHSSIAGRKYGSFFGDDIFTTSESEKIVRLPMYFDLSFEDVDFIINIVKRYFYEK
ncbi:dTDP-4-amino-4,6-dideoxygalactose transaminase [Francisella philomiragia]|uniref:dTDP-4-amino-4,6-dideoxygalactose transaminase n=1 Tax=Francisella philomiragia TaxID=28110 RepID=UPI001B8B9C70|nr:dTDP-4-amino-4,6-dideoxygalactose transaminase [Francisella philomiragia]QUE30742.1 dTDP-4-amino-4,6-dideoxygalactose transaminase [Francisella philomiragia]